MLTLRRTDSQNQDFINLVKKLDASLEITDGDDHAFYSQFNKIDHIRRAVVVYEGDEAVGCGALKAYEAKTVEVKRMYVDPNSRGRGIASRILSELEGWAAELGFEKCILETGTRQFEAVALYKKSNYKITENYGQYIGVTNSLCFEKILTELTS